MSNETAASQSTKIQPGAREWHKQQITEYQKEFSFYQQYAVILQEILEQAAKLYAPLAIVQTRPKTLSSFAEKAIRKAFKYDDPVHQLTDLCGGRVITHTQDQVEKICRFIKENFIIDEANSLDVLTRLKVSEFGYRSVHYVVQLKADKFPEMAKIAQIGGRRAEIQVRTLLQHAWADICHDRIYKSSFVVPEKWVRESARLAAVLENADGAFVGLANGIDAYKSNYGTYMTRERMQTEIETLGTILKNEPSPKKQRTVAIQIAKIAKAAGDWEIIIKNLTPYAGEESGESMEILMELGHALCRAHKEQHDSPKYKTGQLYLEKAAKPEENANNNTSNGDQKELRAEALSLLADSYRDLPGQETKIKDLYQKVFQLTPANPYRFVSYLEYDIYCRHDKSFLPLMRYSLLEAINSCKSHATVRIELPWAYFTMGKLYLLLGEIYDSLTAYAKAIQLCVTENICIPEDIYDTQIEFLNHINYPDELPEEHQWVKQLLLLGKSVSLNQEKPLAEIKSMALRQRTFRKPVLIIAGGTSTSIEDVVGLYREHIRMGLNGFQGTVISGGTSSGVPGLVGSVAKEYREKGNKQFQLVGYLPEMIPSNTSPDERYDEFIKTNSRDFSPLQPLQNWIDLLAGGVKPAEVRLLGINGGEIAAFEYRLALALGAKVGIIESTGRAATDLLSDSDWWSVPNLLRLPQDIMIVRAFLKPGRSQVQPDQLEKLGRTIHEKYLDECLPASIDPFLQPWENLRDDLRESNIHQAAYAEEILRSIGYGIRTAVTGIKPVEFNKKEIEAMAEMEHGRWVVERLQNGWRYGSHKDTSKKISPYLKPWWEIPENIKDYDRNAVRNYPTVLHEAGLEVYCIERNVNE
jgi:ppGpp synthetase/RelA/SpoT-type nucleotidyltranferase